MTVGVVLFDWGHTLFDTAGSVEFIVAWSAERGITLDAGEVHLTWDRARRRSRSAEEIAYGRDKDIVIHRARWTALQSELDEMSPGVGEALYEFETSAAGWSPYVDTREVLEALAAKGVPAVIVSDVPFDLRPIFAHYGIEHLIHTFVLSGEHGTIKPELRLFGIALEAVGVAAEHALMVGDNHINDGAAIDAGIRTLLLPHAPSGQPRGLWAVLDLVEA